MGTPSRSWHSNRDYFSICKDCRKPGVAGDGGAGAAGECFLNSSFTRNFGTGGCAKPCYKLVQAFEKWYRCPIFPTWSTFDHSSSFQNDAATTSLSGLVATVGLLLCKRTATCQCCWYSSLYMMWGRLPSLEVFPGIPLYHPWSNRWALVFSLMELEDVLTLCVVWLIRLTGCFCRAGMWKSGAPAVIPSQIGQPYVSCVEHFAVQWVNVSVAGCFFIPFSAVL